MLLAYRYEAAAIPEAAVIPRIAKVLLQDFQLEELTHSANGLRTVRRPSITCPSWKSSE